jgi:alpha-tubulin suppressor-like RCC1 family protein
MIKALVMGTVAAVLTIGLLAAQPSSAAIAGSSVLAWGGNWSGQLGSGNNAGSSTPVGVKNLSDVTSVAGGSEHSLALKADGTVWAWGENGSGQLGNGTNADSNTPVQVRLKTSYGLTFPLTGVKAIAAGGHHSLALRNDGTVWAWGHNGIGELGIGTYVDKNTAVKVTALSGITAIAGGGNHSLALKDDGTVLAWGSDAYGQLGDGVGGAANSNNPVQVVNLSNVTAIEGGDQHSLALKADGKVRAWGDNTYGQLGNGTLTDSDFPVTVNNLANVKAIAAGNGDSLALRYGGTVMAWGDNTFGQLGNGISGLGTKSVNPAPVSNLSDVKSIAAGDSHNLALKYDGTMRAWGYNTYGQLGNGTNADSDVPVPMSIGGIKFIAGGSYHSLAVRQ